jgi:hypothetical protein
MGWSYRVSVIIIIKKTHFLLIVTENADVVGVTWRNVRTLRAPHQPIPMFREVLEILLEDENRHVKLTVSVSNCSSAGWSPSTSEHDSLWVILGCARAPSARLQSRQRPRYFVLPCPKGTGRIRELGRGIGA